MAHSSTIIFVLKSCQSNFYLNRKIWLSPLRKHTANRTTMKQVEKNQLKHTNKTKKKRKTEIFNQNHTFTTHYTVWLLRFSNSSFILHNFDKKTYPYIQTNSMHSKIWISNDEHTHTIAVIENWTAHNVEYLYNWKKTISFFQKRKITLIFVQCVCRESNSPSVNSLVKTFV